MGIESRRVLNDIKEKKIADYEKQILDISGAKVTIDMDWKSIESDPKAADYLENDSLDQLLSAIRWGCRDDAGAGKKAVQDGLKKVVFKNIADASKKKITIKEKVMTIEEAFAKRPEGLFDSDAIYKELEAAL